MNPFKKLMDLFLGKPESPIADIVERDIDVGKTEIKVTYIDGGETVITVTGYPSSGYISSRGIDLIHSDTLAESFLAKCAKTGAIAYKDKDGSHMVPMHRISEIVYNTSQHLVKVRIPCK